MAGTFEEAALNLIRKLEQGLYESARDVMRESIQECPISGPETYVPQIRTVAGRLMYFGDDPEMVGDNGTLRRSARVFPPANSGSHSTVTLGYGFGEEVNPAGRVAAEYAVPVHERSELRHAPPTKSHFLSDVVLAFAARFPVKMAQAARTQESTAPTELTGTDLGA